MAPPPINKSVRYKARGKTKCYFVPTIANLQTGPTRAELDAGVDLSPQIMDNDGWQIQSGSIDTPDLASEFTSNIPAGTNVDDCSITFYSDRNGDDVRAVLPRGTEGNIVWLHGGDIPGNFTLDGYPIRVGSVGKPVTLDDDASSIQVNFNIIDEPAEDLEIPA